MKTALILVVILIVACGLLFAFRFNLSAAPDPGSFEARVATAGKHWFVWRGARANTISEPAANSSSLDSGGMTFNGDCAFCHGQDGTTPTDVGKAMYPRVPSLASPQVQRYSDSELFWIIHNGTRYTGMGAFGKSLSDEQIWDLVHYIRSLRNTSPAAK